MQRLSTISATPPKDYLLAFARARFALARVRRLVEHKAGFDPSQPRDDRGRWTSGGGSGNQPGGQTVATDRTGEESWSTVVSDWNGDGTLAQELVFNRDGSTILSEFAAAGDSTAWDERHTVTVPDGGRFRFDSAGDTQTISDATSGEVLSRATWEKDGPRDEAVVSRCSRRAEPCVPSAGRSPSTAGSARAPHRRNAGDRLQGRRIHAGRAAQYDAKPGRQAHARRGGRRLPAPRRGAVSHGRCCTVR